MTEQRLNPRVLVVTATFPPDAAVGTLRTVRLLRQLAESGWSIDVLTISPATYRPGTVTDTGLLARIPGGVRVIHARALRPAERLTAMLRPGRVRTGGAQGAPVKPAVAPVSGSARGGLWRIKQAASAMLTLPDREVSWLAPALLTGWKATRHARPDVIYSSGPPFTAHLVAAFMSGVLRRRWVADFRDPWARAPWRGDRFGFEKRAWSFFERLVVTRAHSTVFVTDGNRRDFARHYGERIARRFYTVANGCDPTDFDDLTPRPSAERFTLLHAGSLYGARNPAPLFRAVAAAIARGAIDPERFRIRLIGRVGISGVDLPSLVRDLRLTGIVDFAPHMPRRAVLQEMLDASALLVVQPITTVSVPGKLYEYLAAGRPILALAEPDGETADLVRRSPGGVAVRADDEPAIERALLDLTGAAPHPVCRRPREMYDGRARAAELEKILINAAAALHHGIPRLQEMTVPGREIRRS